MPAIVTTPATRGLNTLGRPKAPRHSFDYDNGRDAICTSGRSGSLYGVTDRPGFCPCQCHRASYNQGCSHFEQFRAAQSAIAHFRESWPNLRPLSVRPYFERCPWPLCGGERLRVSFRVGVGEIVFIKLFCPVCKRSVTE